MLRVMLLTTIAVGQLFSLTIHSFEYASPFRVLFYMLLVLAGFFQKHPLVGNLSVLC